MSKNVDAVLVAIKMLPYVDQSALPLDDPEIGKDHLKEMVKKIVRGQITGEKAHRWIGWIQACLCFGKALKLEEMSRINAACVTVDDPTSVKGALQLIREVGCIDPDHTFFCTQQNHSIYCPVYIASTALSKFDGRTDYAGPR